VASNPALCWAFGHDCQRQCPEYNVYWSCRYAQTTSVAVFRMYFFPLLAFMSSKFLRCNMTSTRQILVSLVHPQLRAYAYAYAALLPAKLLTMHVRTHTSSLAMVGTIVLTALIFPSIARFLICCSCTSPPFCQCYVGGALEAERALGSTPLAQLQEISNLITATTWVSNVP
jgi:hypothetical protein